VIDSLKNSLGTGRAWQNSDAVAHTAAVRVIVGGKPIHSSKSATQLVDRLKKQREYYRTKARYREAADRLRMQELFEKAIAELEGRET
jgi:hypothetical protein